MTPLTQGSADGCIAPVRCWCPFLPQGGILCACDPSYLYCCAPRQVRNSSHQNCTCIRMRWWSSTSDVCAFSAPPHSFPAFGLGLSPLKLFINPKGEAASSTQLAVHEWCDARQHQTLLGRGTAILMERSQWREAGVPRSLWPACYAPAHTTAATRIRRASPPLLISHLAGGSWELVDLDGSVSDTTAY